MAAARPDAGGGRDDAVGDLPSDMAGAHPDAGGGGAEHLPEADLGPSDWAGPESWPDALLDASAGSMLDVASSLDMSVELVLAPSDSDAPIRLSEAGPAMDDGPMIDVGTANGSLDADPLVDAADGGNALDAASLADAPRAGDDTVSADARAPDAISQVTFNAYDLTRTASDIGSDDRLDDGGKCPDTPCEYIQFTQGETPARGDWIEFTLPSLEPGTYSVRLDYKSAYTRGIVQAKFDGTTFGSSCDQYSSDFVYYVYCSLGSLTVRSSGSHLLRLTVTGRNSASAGYSVTFERFIFTSM